MYCTISCKTEWCPLQNFRCRIQLQTPPLQETAVNKLVFYFVKCHSLNHNLCKTIHKLCKTIFPRGVYSIHYQNIDISHTAVYNAVASDYSTTERNINFNLKGTTFKKSGSFWKHKVMETLINIIPMLYYYMYVRVCWRQGHALFVRCVAMQESVSHVPMPWFIVANNLSNKGHLYVHRKCQLIFDNWYRIKQKNPHHALIRAHVSLEIEQEPSWTKKIQTGHDRKQQINDIAVREDGIYFLRKFVFSCLLTLKLLQHSQGSTKKTTFPGIRFQLSNNAT